MRERICNNCGGSKYKEIGQNMVKCLFCGTIYVDEYANKEEEILIVQAYEKLRSLKFEEAVSDFEKIIALYPKSHEAYFGKVQAKYKVLYLTGKSRTKRYPTFYGKEIPSYLNDEDFLKAVEYAPKEIAENYNEQAQYVEEVRQMWVNEASKQEPFDVVLNLNEKDERFKDIKAALEKEGLRVFVRADEKKGKKRFEAFLFHAAKSCKVEICCVGEKNDFLNPKIKSLADRFIYRIEEGDRFPSSFVVVHDKNLSLADIKKYFPKLQMAFSVADISFLDDLVTYTKQTVERKYNENVSIEKKEVGRVAPNKIEKVPVAHVVPSDLGHYTVESVPLSEKNKVKWIFFSIKNGDFETAEKLIKEEQENGDKSGELVFAEIMCNKKIKTEEEFFSNISNIADKEKVDFILKNSSKEFAEDFVNKMEELIIDLKDVDVYVANLVFFAKYNNSKREEFLKSAEDLALTTLNEELIDAVLKSFTSDEVDKYINFYFQLAQTTGNEKYYEKILDIDEGHMPSHYALFIKNFDTVEEKLNYRDATVLENVLKYCSEEQGSNFLYAVCDIIVDVSFYDIKKVEEQLDFYLAYISDDKVLEKVLKNISSKLQSQGFFSLAEKYLSLAIKNDKENAELYWQLLQIKTHCKSENELLTTSVKIADMPEWSAVLNYADEAQAEKYAQIVSNSNITTAKKVFREELLDKHTLSSKLREFITRNNNILNDVQDRAAANYYQKQLQAFEIYFDKIDKANTFESYVEVFNRIDERLEVMDLTLDTSVNVAKLTQKKDGADTLEKEAKKRDEKYLSALEVEARDKRRKKILFICLEVVPMTLVFLLLLFVATLPKDMYLFTNQDAVLLLTIFSVLLGLGNLIYNLVRKNRPKKWIVARYCIFSAGIVNLFFLLFGFYIFPPTITVNNADEFNRIVHNAGYVNVSIEDDIDMVDIEWKSVDFYGEIDGNGYQLSNVKFASNRNVYALFGSFNGELRDLRIVLAEDTLEDVDVFAGIAATNYGTIENCHVTGSVRLTLRDGGFAGGVVGSHNSGEISRCSTDLNIIASSEGTYSFGGIAGRAERNSRSPIINGSFSDIAFTSNDGEVVFGGVVGQGENLNLTMTESYSTVDVDIQNAQSGSVGGLAGYLRSDIENCYAVGSIDITNYSTDINVGGVVGELSRRDKVVEHVYSAIVITTNGRAEQDGETLPVGALIGRISEGILRNSFAVSDLERVYGEIHANDALATEPTNCDVITDAAEFTNIYEFSTDIWNIENGVLPTLKIFSN